MSSPASGTYIVRPKTSPDQALLIGPVPLIYPPPDVPLRVSNRPIDRWIINVADDNTGTVFAGRGKPNDYKWILNKNNVLYVSSVRPADSFRLESAGNNFRTIKLPGQDAALTYDEDAFPSLTFKPADGSDAQLYEFIQIDRD